MAKKSSTGDKLFGILEDWRKKNLDPDPFDDPKYNANFRHWLQMPVWTAHEAITLSLGKDPRKIQRDNAIQSHHYGEPEVTFRTQYADRFEILDRSLSELGVGSANPLYRYLAKVEPDTFVCWAKGKGWELPKELEALANATDLLSAEASNPEEFKNVEGLNWEDVTLTLLRGDDIQASAGNLTQRVPLSALNLISRKGTKKTNERFMLLIAWAQGGQVSAKTTKGIRDHVYKLRKSLKTYFGITTNPVHAVGGTYTPRFHLIDKRDAADKRAKERAERKTVSFDETNLAHQGSLETGPASVSGETICSESDEYPFEQTGKLENDLAAEFLSKKRRD